MGRGFFTMEVMINEEGLAWKISRETRQLIVEGKASLDKAYLNT